MTRTHVINTLIDKFNYESYLEIGTRNPDHNFNSIKAKHKVSIDPNTNYPNITFIGTSDDYFKSISEDIKYDIVFIDGLHHSDQVLRDIENSLKHLSDNGTIVCHDCLPISEENQVIPDNGGCWTGDVWKAIAQLRSQRTDLDIKVIDTDWGCGIIRRGTNTLYNISDELTYQYYVDNKQEMMNIISTEQFQTIYL
jgi:hypothetical protein